MSKIELGPLPEPFMELHKDLAPHVYNAWADQMRAYAEQEVAKERAYWHQAMRTAVRDTAIGMDGGVQPTLWLEGTKWSLYFPSPG